MTAPPRRRNTTSAKTTLSQPIRPGQRDLLPLAVVLAELGDEHGPLARSTFDDWRARGVAPKVIKLPNGQIRIDRYDLNTWLDSRIQNPAA
ncbi:hypothetical protein FDG2_6317 [Candidatus Protofrankia californiensis]|uniref:Helix-turn-helix domain-containing protein n=1 Tax=Candidatus Protofrankia californiensis TaxID=1839754 RepID=A0A1C3PGS9_9ACTN|nr:hypothetical protein FDG2_6317 [Candidatus Protofrankia californiensis]